MSRLADTFQRCLDELGMSARGLETKAHLPHMTLGLIKQGSHPRADRFDRLLDAIPGLTHRVELLIAYTLDDCPERYQSTVEHVLRSHLYEHLRSLAADPDPAPATVAESDPNAPARPLSTATRARQVLAEMARSLDNGDTALADWLATTGTLLTTPHHHC